MNGLDTFFSEYGDFIITAIMTISIIAGLTTILNMLLNGGLVV